MIVSNLSMDNQAILLLNIVLTTCRPDINYAKCHVTKATRRISNIVNPSVEPPRSG